MTLSDRSRVADRNRLLLMGALLVLFSLPAFLKLAAVYADNADFSHGFLVPAVAGYAAWRKRRKWTDAAGRPTAWGLPVLFGGCGIALVGYWYDVALAPGGMAGPFLFCLGLIAVLAGFVLLLKGPRTLLEFAFPIGYLVFAAPIPFRLADQVTVPLRLLITGWVAACLKAFGIPVLQEGNILRLAHVSLGVADACSGIRSLWVLLAAAAGLAHFAELRKWRFWALVGAAAPCAVLGNFIRVLATTLLAARGAVAFAFGWRHEAIGWACFLIGVGLLAGLLRLLSPRVEDDEEPEASVAQPSPKVEVPSASRFAPATAVAILLGGTIAMYVLGYHYAAKARVESGRLSLAAFPEKLGSFQTVQSGELGYSDVSVLRPTENLLRIYAAPGRPRVLLILIYWAPVRLRLTGGVGGPHSPASCMPLSGWELVAERTETVRIPGLSGDTLELRCFQKGGVERLVIFWRKTGFKPPPHRKYTSVAGRWIGRLVESWHAPAADVGSQYFVSVSVESGGEAPFAVARETALAFAEALAGVLPEYGFRQVSESGDD